MWNCEFVKFVTVFVSLKVILTQIGCVFYLKLRFCFLGGLGFSVVKLPYYFCLLPGNLAYSIANV